MNAPTDATEAETPFNNVRIGMSPTISKLAAAMAKAQGDIRTAAMSAVNPHFKKDYADLADVRDACREPLAKNGLSVVQMPFGEDGKIALRSVLLHESGEFMWSDLPGANWKNPQELGSLLTYLRRYALSSITGVAPRGEDDDGEGAMGRRPDEQGRGNDRGSGNGNREPSQGPKAQPSAGPPPIPDVVKPYADKFGEVTTQESFHALLNKCRDTFPEGTPERKAFNHVVNDAAKRLGLTPKKPQGQSS